MKKIIAAILSIAIMLTLAGCGSDSIYIMKVNGEEVKAGLYIIAQSSALGEAQSLYVEANPDVDTSEDDFKFEDTQIEGVDFIEWVKKRAVELTAKVYVVEELFKEQGLTLEGEALSAVKTEIDQKWDTDIYLEQMYSMLGEQMYQYGVEAGGETWGQYFQDKGVSRDSFNFYYTAIQKEAMIFESIYGEEGTNPVSDKAWQEIFKKDYIRVRAVEFNTALTSDETGETEDQLSEDELKKLRNFEKEQLEFIKDGGSFYEVNMAYQTFLDELLGDGTEENNQEDEADDDDDDDDDNNSDSDDEDDNDFDLNAEMDKSFEEYIKVGEIEEDNEILSFIANLKQDVPEIYEDENADYIFMRLDVLGNEDVFDEYRSNIVIELKSEEFNDMLEDRAKTMVDTVIQINQTAYDRYDPRKLMDNK